MLFAHANGFCASAYRQMFEALGSHYDVFAVDLRGFGASELQADPHAHRSWRVFASDICEFVAKASADFSISGEWTFSGHSLGAASAMIASASIGKAAAVRLIEPVATTRLIQLLALTPLWPLVTARMPLVRGARGRRAKWADRDSVRASYAKKALFETWACGVLDDYLADGLRVDAGGVCLSCDPAWEAAVFAAKQHDFWGAAKKTPRPMKVLAAQHPSTTVPRSSVRRFERLGVKVERAHGFSHLLPFEAPDLAAEFLTKP